jgi:hypothetical protein
MDITEWEAAESTLHAYVLQCVKHLERKNFVQLKETLEYDGAHALEKWRVILSTMKEKVSSDESKEQSLSLPIAISRKGGG